MTTACSSTILTVNPAPPPTRVKPHHTRQAAPAPIGTRPPCPRIEPPSHAYAPRGRSRNAPRRTGANPRPKRAAHPCPRSPADAPHPGRQFPQPAETENPSRRCGPFHRRYDRMNHGSGLDQPHGLLVEQRDMLRGLRASRNDGTLSSCIHSRTFLTGKRTMVPSPRKSPIRAAGQPKNHHRHTSSDAGEQRFLDG